MFPCSDQQPILILDDHKLFLNGLQLIIEQKLSCPNHGFCCEHELRKKWNLLEEAQLLISDIELAENNTLALLNEIKELFPNLPILVVSMHKKASVISTCMEIGVEGYILKDEDQLLLPAIENLLKGNEFYSPEVLRFYNKIKGQYECLTQKELEVLKEIFEGHSNPEISKHLNISIETLKTHKKNLKLKLGLLKPSDFSHYAQDIFI